MKDIITGDPLGLWKQCPEDWKEYKLWDIADYINGRAFKPTDFSLVGLPVIKITELKYGLSQATNLYAGEYDPKYLLKNGDLLFAWSGNPETSLDAFRWSGGKALLNQHIFRVIPRDLVEPTFLYFLFKYLRSTFVRTARDKATSMGHVKISDLKRLIAKVPPFSEQKAIAAILGTLDDKIELNRKMNETLEAIARAIFKSWFVDFDPIPGYGPHKELQDSPLGRIPKGWRVAPIGDLVKVVGGSTPRTSEPSYWGGGYSFATPKDMATLTSPFLLDTERQITKAGLDCISSGLLPVGTVLLSSRAPIGYLAIADIQVAVNQGFIAMVCDGELPNHYVLHWTKENMEVIKGKANGTTFLEISKSNFRPIPAIAPPSAVLEKFVAVVGPMHQRIIANLKQSRTLAAIRDALLPKFLSGEIRVKDATKFQKGEYELS